MVKEEYKPLIEQPTSSQLRAFDIVPDNRCHFQYWLARKKGDCIDLQFSPKLIAIGFSAYILEMIARTRKNMFGLPQDNINMNGEYHYRTYFYNQLQVSKDKVKQPLRFGDWEQKVYHNFCKHHVAVEQAYWEESKAMLGYLDSDEAEQVKDYTEAYLQVSKGWCDACLQKDIAEAQKQSARESVKAKIETIADKAIEKGLMQRNNDGYTWHKNKILLAYLMGRLFLNDSIEGRYWLKGEEDMPNGYWRIIEELFLESDLSSSLKNAKCKNNIPRGYKEIDSLFE